ncbi:class I SAM-dependent methyltransferase [Nocardioides bruguierae]|uniref:Class I SAM-dependent methyltransferase n=1 Tax=Nocardioides bruguierae TaxID=2945102 RepID=A0A9X2D7Y3_9ACTN|nr:class I SAM-dependent methyltransferase [Nocardioides bruguierae]MCM0620937.1 class I SAM-dependent methyltransferase [Nocardioides bruguierae]
MSGGWNDPGVAAAYAETFAPLCAGVHPAVLAALGDVAGRRVLDAGAGTGTLTHRLAAADAQVVAVEPDPAMRALADASLGLVEGALPALPLSDDAVDAAASVFVVNHLDDPRAAVADLTRVTRSGGRVVVTIWPSGANVQGRLWEQVLAEAGAVRPPGVRLPADRDFSRTVEGLADLLAGAGLVDVRAREVAWTHACPPDTLWRGAAGGVGGIGVTLRAQTPEVQQAMRAAHDRHVADLLVDGTLRLETSAVLAVGVVAG